MSRLQTLSDAEWDLIEDFMPSSDGRRGRRFSDHRLVVEGIIYRYRTGVAWRDLPAEFGPWQTVWKRHRRFAGDGTWDKVLTALLTRADTMGVIDWDRFCKGLKEIGYKYDLSFETFNAMNVFDSALSKELLSLLHATGELFKQRILG